MININDKKVQKKFIKLIMAVSRACDTDLILLNALTIVESNIRDSKRKNNVIEIETRRLVEEINNNKSIIALLTK